MKGIKTPRPCAPEAVFAHQLQQRVAPAPEYTQSGACGARGFPGKTGKPSPPAPAAERCSNLPNHLRPCQVGHLAYPPGGKKVDFPADGTFFGTPDRVCGVGNDVGAWEWWRRGEKNSRGHFSAREKLFPYSRRRRNQKRNWKFIRTFGERILERYICYHGKQAFRK